MPFNSLRFLTFVSCVFLLHLSLRRHLRAQNLLLLLASLIFYGMWSMPFLGVMLALTLITYAGALLLARSAGGRRRAVFVLCVAANLGALIFFKYWNFLIQSIDWALREPNHLVLHLLAPLGISFTTFKSIGYLMDVDSGVIAPTPSVVDYSLYTLFFVNIAAGPIERAERFLPQLIRERPLNWAMIDEGVYLILWGFFKKTTVADPLANIFGNIFARPRLYAGLDLLLADVAFGIQLYADFSGYTDVARGIGKCLGFDLSPNFNQPYFAQNPEDFWSRWHISLSTWFHDYFYLPLGMWVSRNVPALSVGALWLTMVLIGLWHGPLWTFVLFGAYHGFLVVGYRSWKRWRKKFAKRLPGVNLGFVPMLVAVFAGWIFFRAQSFSDAFYFFTHMSLRRSALSMHLIPELVFYSVPLVLMEIWQRRKGDLLVAQKAPLSIRAPLYSGLLLWIFLFGARETLEFLYFKF